MITIGSFPSDSNYDSFLEKSKRLGVVEVTELYFESVLEQEFILPSITSCLCFSRALAQRVVLETGLFLISKSDQETRY